MKKALTGTLLALIVLSVIACGPQPVRQDDGREGFVYLHDVIPDAILDVRYFSSDNFMGTRVDGYHNHAKLPQRPKSLFLRRWAVASAPDSSVWRDEHL